MATSTTRRSSREGAAKTSVADQISQTVRSTSNLLHLMQQSSASHMKQKERQVNAQLRKLPMNLLAKTSIIKNTGQLLEQMPHVISSLDAHMENGLHSVPHLQPVVQLLANMESCQLNSLFQAHLSHEELGLAKSSEVP